MISRGDFIIVEGRTTVVKYIADAQQICLIKLSSDMGEVSHVTETSTGTRIQISCKHFPFSITTHAYNNVYVVGRKENRVKILDSRLNLRRAIQMKDMPKCLSYSR